MQKLNDIVHTFSSKPILHTTRDAIIVATITVIILIIGAFLYYYMTDNLKYMKTTDYWKGVGKSFLTGMILGYVYEYGGFNARFSAEAMRYAKGSILDKYQTRNEALVAEIAAEQYREEVEREIRKNPSCGIKLEDINENIDKINAMVKSTRELKLIARLYDQSSEDILKALKARYQTHLTVRDIEHLKNLDPNDKENNISRLNSVSRLVELFGANIDLVKYFIKNGFSKLNAVKSKNGWTIDVDQLSKDTGVPIRIIGLGGSVVGEVPTQTTPIDNELRPTDFANTEDAEIAPLVTPN